MKSGHKNQTGNKKHCFGRGAVSAAQMVNAVDIRSIWDISVNQWTTAVQLRASSKSIKVHQCFISCRKK